MRLTNRRGIATIEFALIAPVMVTVIFGTIELSNVFRIQAKVNTATGLLASFVAGGPSATAPSGSLADQCTGALLNLAPFPSAGFSADIASITNDHPSNRVAGSTDATTIQTYLDWENISSCPTRSASTMALAGAYALANSPQSMLTRNAAPASTPSDLAYSYSAIIVTTSYRYSNILTFVLGQTITLNGVAVVRPRSNATVACTNVPGGTACPSLQ